MKVYNKLIRDKIPNILKRQKVKFKSHKANDSEYINKLYDKFLEEFAEFKENPSIEEFADILEVLESIGKVHKFNLEEIKIMKSTKKISRGGFDKKIILDEADEQKKA